MAQDQVETFNRALRAWVKNITGTSIGNIKDPRFPRATIYRRTQGSNLLSLDDLKTLVARCAPEDLDQAERREWIATEFRPWQNYWRSVEPSSRAETEADLNEADSSLESGSGMGDVTEADGRLDSGSGTDNVNPSSFEASLTLVREKIAEADRALHTSHQPELLTREINTVLGEVADFIEHAIHGRIVRDGTDLRDLIHQTRTCASDIRATTTVTTGALQASRSWWESQGALTYLEENKQAIARGVEIHRVFIVDEFDEVIENFIRSHVELGVHASWLRASSLTPALRTNVLVWDGTIGWRALMTTTGEVSENWLYTSEGDVSRLLATYYACADQAKKV